MWRIENTSLQTCLGVDRREYGGVGAGKGGQLAIHTHTRHKMTVLLPLGNKVGYQIMRVSLGACRVALDLKMAQVAKHSIVALFTHHGRRSAMLSGQALASQVAIRGENDLPGRCVWCSYSRYTHNCGKAPKHLYVRYM